MGHLVTSRSFLGSLGLLFVSISLWAATFPAVDSWHDQWRDYAHRTELGGHCSDAAHADNPECLPGNDGFSIEPWMIVPWLLSAGCFMASLAVASPFVRRRTDA